jgi:MarR family transcriptional regulator, organic hydroperoxide resistance regulator
MASRKTTANSTHASAKRAPAHSLEQDVFIAILKLADALTRQADHLIRTAGFSGVQYNVLRILRGAEPHGLACREIGDRMISHDSDITRLLDRMEKRDLITRERQTDDRRVIKTRITATGLAALAQLDEPVSSMHRHQFAHMSAMRLKTLSALLLEAAAGLAPAGPEIPDSKSHAR